MDKLIKVASFWIETTDISYRYNCGFDSIKDIYKFIQDNYNDGYCNDDLVSIKCTDIVSVYIDSKLFNTDSFYNIDFDDIINRMTMLGL